MKAVLAIQAYKLELCEKNFPSFRKMNAVLSSSNKSALRHKSTKARWLQTSGGFSLTHSSRLLA